MEKIRYTDLDAADLFSLYDSQGKISFYWNDNVKFKREYSSGGGVVRTSIYYPDGKIGIRCKCYKQHREFGKQFLLETWYESGKKQLQATGSERDNPEWYILYHENGQKKEFYAYDRFIRRWDEQGNTIECKYRPNKEWIDIVKICQKDSVSFGQMNLFIDTIIRDLRARNMMPDDDFEYSFRQREKIYDYLAFVKQR